MSKIAERKAKEAYPYPTVMDLVTDEEVCGQLVTKAQLEQSAYIKGYDQAMKDCFEFERKTNFPTDELGDTYRYGYDQAAEEFMKKAEKVFDELYIPKVKFELFKQYMENKYFPPKDKDTSTIIERSTK